MFDVDELLVFVSSVGLSLNLIPTVVALVRLDEAKARKVIQAAPVTATTMTFATLALVVEACARDAADPTAFGSWLCIAPQLPLALTILAFAFELEDRAAKRRVMRLVIFFGALGLQLQALGAVPSTFRAKVSDLVPAIAVLYNFLNKGVRLVELLPLIMGWNKKGNVVLGQAAVWMMGCVAGFAWAFRAGAPLNYKVNKCVDIVAATLNLVTFFVVTARLRKEEKQDRLPRLTRPRSLTWQEALDEGCTPRSSNPLRDVELAIVDPDHPAHTAQTDKVKKLDDGEELPLLALEAAARMAHERDEEARVRKLVETHSNLEANGESLPLPLLRRDSTDKPAITDHNFFKTPDFGDDDPLEIDDERADGERDVLV
ncbi:hypothetical protein M885DRAFT_618812 [Pelagophyceae sp. CCMP2097]|nr:hypothetical protein M885DRAFT_618812 [Pelagophyceae sp. CCMP2097]|mmetsp:Transcript_23913/g.81766  ORF Transcript_23913/g.81766 Transcript_23913/m.81766 type:complete len:373 (+) Transcript_23913:190-1308(+)